MCFSWCESCWKKHCQYSSISDALSNVSKRACAAGLLVLVLIVVIVALFASPSPSLDDEARLYLSLRDATLLPLIQRDTLATWNYQSNLTKENMEAMETSQLESMELNKKLWQNFKDEGWLEKLPKVKDERLYRQLKKIALQGGVALTNEEFAEMTGLISNMSSIYSTARVDLCVQLNGQKTCNLTLEPDLTNLLVESKNYDELLAAWVGWRNVSGSKVRGQYLRYVQLANKQAKLNNFTDLSEQYISVYETDNFRDQIEKLYQDVRPLYMQLHAYVRRKLRGIYGEEKVTKRGPIPAHLLGNMWAQNWDSISDTMAPYPNKHVLDVTGAMKKKGYTPIKMVQLADKFFKDLNLTGMSEEFWNNSIFEKPPNTEMICHASAWSFYNGNDFRIKMCMDVTMEKLGTIHHEMGHIEYYMQYNDQPILFKEGANPGFHEAVGDALALSVLTPKHMQKIGLLDTSQDDTEADLNFLMTNALAKVAFLPFGYLIDSYRWDVFSGNITSDNLNCAWWQKRYDMQGLKPPVIRSEKDFDPGAKYHVVADVPYIRYFVSFIIQFQFHKALCLKAGQYDPQDQAKPLYKCDIDSSKEAGEALSSMLKMGSARPWPEALQILTGSKDMDVGVLKEYFEPLEKWLKKDNVDNEEFIGWEKDEEKYCVSES